MTNFTALKFHTKLDLIKLMRQACAIVVMAIAILSYGILAAGIVSSILYIMVSFENDNLIVIIKNYGNTEELLSLIDSLIDAISMLDKSFDQTVYYDLCSILRALIPDKSQIKIQNIPI